MPSPAKGLVKPTVYETIDVVPLRDIDSEFDYGVDIVNRGNSFIADNQNLVELRQVQFKEIKPGTYHRFGDILLRQREDNQDGLIADNFILEQKKLKQELQAVVVKVRGLPAIRQRIKDGSRLRRESLLRDRDGAKTARRLEEAMETIGDRILDDTAVRQFYFDRTKVAVVERPKRELRGPEDRLSLIREISNQVIEKYFSLVKKARPKTKLDQLALSRMKELEKQREVEEFIRKHLEAVQVSQEQPRPVKQVRRPRGAREQVLRLPSSPRREEGHGIDRVAQVQHELINQVGEAYKPKVQQYFNRILRVMEKR